MVKYCHMPFKAGQKPPANAGRKKGTPNRITRTVEEILARAGCDPIEILSQIANGEVKCGTCHGTGTTKFKVAGTDRLADRICESCYGTKLEKIAPDLRHRASSTLAEYRYPKRKAIEHSGPGGNDPIKHELTVVFVDPKDRQSNPKEGP